MSHDSLVAAMLLSASQTGSVQALSEMLRKQISAAGLSKYQKTALAAELLIDVIGNERDETQRKNMQDGVKFLLDQCFRALDESPAN